MLRMEQRRLGRGLHSLLPAEPVQAGVASLVSVDILSPNRSQPREHMDEAALAGLAESIRKNGILQPIVARRQGERLEIISGERRWRAAQKAGLASVPVVIRENVTESEMLELAILENVQRVDLNPIEKARGYRRLIDEFGKTQEDVAKGVGQDRATVANLLRLLDLPEEMQDAVQRSSISGGHARALLSVPDPIRRKLLFERVLRDDLSVRDVERLAGESGARRKPIARRRSSIPVWISELEERWRRRLGVRVEFSMRGQKSRIAIHCATLDELERVTDLAVGLPHSTQSPGHSD
jgi:ParB family chromosome partitioning protein